MLAARDHGERRMSTPLLELIDVARYFDVSPPWLKPDKSGQAAADPQGGRRVSLRR
jgi:hypothetical protein